MPVYGSSGKVNTACHAPSSLGLYCAAMLSMAGKIVGWGNGGAEKENNDMNRADAAQR